LYKIVINCAYKYLQRNKLLVDEKDSESVIPVEIIDETIEQADLEEKQFIVNQALQRVSADSALALTLFYMQEYSIKEVCELTGWTESKTKVTLHRARHNMKKAICEVKITYKIEA
jgi:RNA polymerase sigma-70 factor (ECF subfamily)